MIAMADHMTQLEPHGRPRRFGLLWLAGIVAILVTLTVAALLNQAGHFVASMVCACLCALSLIPIGIFIARGKDGEDDWGAIFAVAFCGVVIVFGASLAGQDDVMLFGRSARDVVAAQAPEAGATFLHFRDARVLVDRTVRVPVFARESLKPTFKPYIAYYATFAPIVDRDWTPGQPVAAFAFIGSPTFGHHTAEWRQPWNAGILANATIADEQNSALGKFRTQGGLSVSSGAVVLRWSANPEGEAAAARGRLLNAALIAAAFWSLTAIIGFVVAVRRRRRDGLRHS